MMDFHFEKTPAFSWEQLIESRIQRSAVVGTAKTKAATATFFYDKVDQKFSLLLRIGASEHFQLFDCELRDQHGGMAIIFLQVNHGGHPIAYGHAVLRGKQLLAKFKAGYTFAFQVDPSAAYFQSMLGQRVRDGAGVTHDVDDEPDLSEMDLRRLRGEVAIHEPQTAQVTRGGARRWRH